MARLDPRLIPLIETLTAAGADWLAFEMVDGLRRGQEQIESEDVLAAARVQARKALPPAQVSEPPLTGSATTSLRGDEQVIWARKYVGDRLDSLLKYMSAALEHLEALVGQDASRLPNPPQRSSEITIVLQDNEAVRQVSRADIAQALAAIPSLRTALDMWANQTSGLPQP